VGLNVRAQTVLLGVVVLPVFAAMMAKRPQGVAELVLSAALLTKNQNAAPMRVAEF